ncbi:hypothetical protein HOY80DRAFT_860005, partial [Tuber brumale]
YSVALPLPRVVTELGFSGTSATSIICSPYGLGFIVVPAAGYTSGKCHDRFKHHFPGPSVMAFLIVLMVMRGNIVMQVLFFLVIFMSVPIPV